MYVYVSIYEFLLTAVTSFEHRGPQSLLTLTRSTSPPLDQFPSARVLVSPLYYEPSMNMESKYAVLILTCSRSYGLTLTLGVS